MCIVKPKERYQNACCLENLKVTELIFEFLFWIREERNGDNLFDKFWEVYEYFF